ncbi:hypothetical protein PCL_08536 [Purpureocillium lilacinum]|uniref:Uncharacterized protein n=2 Tax=Purpureocillium lilacinum TaxID=33203 RepID=A0A2U3DRE8_PURLI|nr:hypothetical protein PCL_08536 [Purpureocillium lilacinum]
MASRPFVLGGIINSSPSSVPWTGATRQTVACGTQQASRTAGRTHCSSCGPSLSISPDEIPLQDVHIGAPLRTATVGSPPVPARSAGALPRAATDRLFIGPRVAYPSPRPPLSRPPVATAHSQRLLSLSRVKSIQRASLHRPSSSMGNICGKAEPNPSPPGRVLGSAPAPRTTSSVPKKVGGPPRTLGGGSGGHEPAGGDSSVDPGDARRRAAEAAEARAKAANKGGKLKAQLNAQKKQSRSDTMKGASEAERRARDADEGLEARQWN